MRTCVCVCVCAAAYARPRRPVSVTADFACPAANAMTLSLFVAHHPATPQAAPVVSAATMNTPDVNREVVCIPESSDAGGALNTRDMMRYVDVCVWGALSMYVIAMNHD